MPWLYENQLAWGTGMGRRGAYALFWTICKAALSIVPKYLYGSKLGIGGQGMRSDKWCYDFKLIGPRVCNERGVRTECSGSCSGFQVESWGGQMSTRDSGQVRFCLNTEPLLLLAPSSAHPSLCLLGPHSLSLHLIYTGLPSAKHILPASLGAALVPILSCTLCPL